jgi:hypothetical protein
MAALGRAGELICPQLPASPKAAMELALNAGGRAPCAGQLAIVGSSLGGFYATWLAERFGCRAVLLNPAVDPLKDLDKHVGVTTAWHSDEPFEFKREYIDELAALKVARITGPSATSCWPPPATKCWTTATWCPLRGRAPARDRGQRPCGVGIRTVCRRGAGVLPTPTNWPDRTRREAGVAAPGALAGASGRRARRCRHARLADDPGLADGAPDRAQPPVPRAEAAPGDALCLADEARRSAWPAAAARVGARSAAALRRPPVVYGHTVVPMSATAQRLAAVLGAGRTLARHDPVLRSAGRSAASSNLPGSARAIRCWRACARRSGDGLRCDTVFHARRCVYRRRQGLLLVTEVFLPAVLNLAAQQHERE